MIPQDNINYQISTILLIFFRTISNVHGNNHINSLLFQVDSFYRNYNTTTIIVPLHPNTIYLRMGHLTTQLKNISKLPIVLNSKSPLKFINGSLQEITHLHDETKSLMELLKSRQIQRHFSKRSAIKNLISSSFEILSPLGTLPFLKMPTKCY